jgi:WD40 repeat protein
VVGIGVGPPLRDLGRKDITPLDSVSASLEWLRFTPDGSKLLTVAMGTGDLRDLSVRTFDAVTGTELRKLTGKEFSKDSLAGACNPNPIALSPDGKVLAAVARRGTKNGILETTALIDAGTGNKFGQLSALPHRLCFSPDSKTLALALEQKIELYGVPGEKLLQTIESANGGRTIVFSPDSKMVAARADAHKLGIWDTVTGKRVGSLPLGEAPTLTYSKRHGMESAAFSADARCLALDMDDGTAVLYELATARARRRFGKKKPAPPAPAPRDCTLPDEFKAGSCFTFSSDNRLLVRGGFDRLVRVYDIQSGTELAAFKGHDGAVTALAFAPNGKRLASASLDSTALIWDVAKLKRPASPDQAPQPGDLEKHWQALAENDAAKAFDSIGALIASPREAVAWIKERIKPARLDTKHVADLIARLDAAPFEVRDKAMSDLSQLGAQVVPELDKALATNPPLETKRRLEDLRGKLTSLLLEGEALRDYRAVEVLEQIATPEARAVLQTLAGGAPGARVTTSAQAALKR